VHGDRGRRKILCRRIGSLNIGGHSKAATLISRPFINTAILYVVGVLIDLIRERAAGAVDLSGKFLPKFGRPYQWIRRPNSMARGVFAWLVIWPNEVGLDRLNPGVLG
jgi:hypothetical protein